jgi:hypothetical protein
MQSEWLAVEQQTVTMFFVYASLDSSHMRGNNILA